MKGKTVQVVLPESLLSELRSMVEPEDTLSSVIRDLIQDGLDARGYDPHEDIRDKLDRILSKLNDMTDSY
ncbi:MAG: hypothetical protein ACE5HR_00430 [bacterium]